MRNAARIALIAIVSLVFWLGGWAPDKGVVVIASILALVLGVMTCLASFWSGNPEIRNQTAARRINQIFLDARENLLPWLYGQIAACLAAMLFANNFLLNASFFLSVWNIPHFAFNLKILIKNRLWIREKLKGK